MTGDDGHVAKPPVNLVQSFLDEIGSEFVEEGGETPFLGPLAVPGEGGSVGEEWRR
jgi:hypothetical protein